MKLLRIQISDATSKQTSSDINFGTVAVGPTHGDKKDKKSRINHFVIARCSFSKTTEVLFFLVLQTNKNKNKCATYTYTVLKIDFGKMK